MAKIALLILAVIAAAQCASIRDVPHKRTARSPCPICSPGLPAPPLISTQNWSGLARTADGHNTVFSGAAAAAAPGVQNAGEAFSLASSDLNNDKTGRLAGYQASPPTLGVQGYSSSNNDNIQSKALGNENYKYANENHKLKLESQSLHQVENTKDFGSLAKNGQNSGVDFGASSSQTASFGANAGNNRNFGEVARGDIQSGNIAPYASNTAQNVEVKPSVFDGRSIPVDHGLNNGISSYARDQEGFGSSQSFQHQVANSNLGDFDDDHSQNAQRPGTFNSQPLSPPVGQESEVSAFGANHNQPQGFVRRTDESQGINQDHLQHGNYDGPTSSPEDVRLALKGALDLTAQGLQAASQTQCSTCSKGSYAFSNAKSYSGSAIALSIGG